MQTSNKPAATFREIPFHAIPHGAVTHYNPAWRTLPVSTVEAIIDFENEWQPFGYTQALFCRNTSSVYLIREEVPQPAPAGQLF